MGLSSQFLYIIVYHNAPRSKLTYSPAPSLKHGFKRHRTDYNFDSEITAPPMKPLVVLIFTLSLIPYLSAHAHLAGCSSGSSSTGI